MEIPAVICPQVFLSCERSAQISL